MTPSNQPTHTPATLTVDNGPRRVRSILRTPDPASQPPSEPASSANAEPRTAPAQRLHAIAAQVRIEVRKFVAILIDTIARFPDCHAAVREVLRLHAIQESSAV